MFLWLGSLVLPGLSLYADQRRLLGAEILATGWLSPLLGNIAWFANPLLLWTFFRLQAGKSALGAAMLGAFVSLDALRFSNYLLNEGGASTPVYGYGWGLVLWLVAIFLMTAASGTRLIEVARQGGGDPGADKWLRPVGFLLCILVLGVSGVLAVRDRAQANEVERARLSGLAFKRGPVCSEVQPTISKPISPNTGPIELMLSEGQYAGSSYPFNKVTTLLKWGVPVVRVDGRDYSYVSDGDGEVLTSVPAAGQPGSILQVATSVREGRREISAKLIEQTTDRTVFEHVWREEAPGRFCPDYSSFPKEDEQPRKLLIDALASPRPTSVQDARPRSPDNRADALIVTNTGSMELAAQGQSLAAGVNASNLQPRGNALWMGNQNCPDNVGWAGRLSEKSPVRLDTGWPFMVGPRAFYPGQRERYSVLCAGDAAYLYVGTARDGKYFLSLEKRKLPDFQRKWTGTVVIQDAQLSTGEELRVDSVLEGAGTLTIALSKDATERRALIKAPLRLSP